MKTEKANNEKRTVNSGKRRSPLCTLHVARCTLTLLAVFALADGTFSHASTAADITPKAVTTTADYVATYTAIVIPQAANAWTGRTMVFTVGGVDYTDDIPNSDDFASDSSYTCIIAVNEKSVTVTSGDVMDWTGTGSSGDVGEVVQIPIPQTVKIPAGKFLMGSPATEPNRHSNEIQHEVTLTKDFYMSKYAVTFAQYDAFCEATGRGKPNDNEWGRGDRPVIWVSWHDAVAYCTWLSEQTGQTWTLPTEAQWEYACRGGQTASLPFGIGDGRKLVSGMANYNIQYSYDLDHSPAGRYDVGNNMGYLGKTSIVGSYSPNNYGLYDMHGNVWEWCSERYGGYSSSPVTDPTGPASGSNRVLRGGSWWDNARFCRSAYRVINDPDHAGDCIGFRVVLIPGGSEE